MRPLDGIPSLNRVIIGSRKNSVIYSCLWYRKIDKTRNIFFCSKMVELGLEMKVLKASVVLSNQWVIYNLICPVYLETKVWSFKMIFQLFFGHWRPKSVTKTQWMVPIFILKSGGTFRCDSVFESRHYRVTWKFSHWFMSLVQKSEPESEKFFC